MIITIMAAPKPSRLAMILFSNPNHAGNHPAKRAIANAANNTMAPCAKLKTPLALKISTNPSAINEYNMPDIRPPNKVSRKKPMSVPAPIDRQLVAACFTAAHLPSAAVGQCVVPR